MLPENPDDIFESLVQSLPSNMKPVGIIAEVILRTTAIQMANQNRAFNELYKCSTINTEVDFEVLDENRRCKKSGAV